MLKRMLTIILCLALLVSALGIAAAEEACPHAEKKPVTVPQTPIYTSEGKSGHRVTVDNMIYNECVKCGERFSGRPGESVTTREAHTFSGGVCTKCGYAERALDAARSNGTSVLNVGAKLQLVPSFATAKGWTVKSYKSSKPWVATVSSDGEVTAIAEGTTKITVRTTNSKKATIKVKVVNPYKPTKVTITQGKTATLALGQTLQLTAVMSPDTAQSALTWKTSKSRVATVSADGLVTPHREGTAKITVSTGNKKKATIKITVVDPYKPTGVSLVQGKSVTLRVGQTLQLTARLAPITAQSTLTWKSGYRRVAVVSADGLVTAVRRGRATITVRTSNGKKAKIRVYVVY